MSVKLLRYLQFRNAANDLFVVLPVRFLTAVRLYIVLLLLLGAGEVDAVLLLSSLLYVVSLIVRTFVLVIVSIDSDICAFTVGLLPLYVV